MPFWSTNFRESTALKDPKRNFRFTVEFGGLDAGQSLVWWAKTVSKPSFSIADAEHKYLNHTFYYPGSVTWNEITLTVVDPVDPDVTATVMDIVTQSGYTPPVDAHSLGTMSKAKAAGALGTITITQIDSEGLQLETWTLWNAYVKDVKFSDLSYGDDNLTETTLTLRYDWAKVETANPSVAAAGSAGKTFFGIAE